MFFSHASDNSNAAVMLQCPIPSWHTLCVVSKQIHIWDLTYELSLGLPSQTLKPLQLFLLLAKCFYLQHNL